MKRLLSIVVISLALAAQAVASAASDSGTALEACQNVGARPLLATLTVERVRGRSSAHPGAIGTRAGSSGAALWKRWQSSSSNRARTC